MYKNDGYKNRVLSLAVRLAFAVSTIGYGQSAFIALVPLIAAFTGIGIGQIGMAAAAGALAFVLGAPLWGALGGRLGHGLTLRMLGLVVLAGQLVLAGLVWVGPSAPLLGLCALVGSRLVYGLGASGVTPVAQAWVSRITAPDERQSMLALVSAGLGAGRILGSAAAITASLAVWLPFLLLVLSPASLLLAPVRAGALDREEAGRTLRLAPFDRRVWPFLAIGFALTMGFGQVQMVLGPLLQARLGMTAASATAVTGLVLTLAAAVMILVQVLVVPRLPFGQRPSVVIGAGLFALGALVFAVAGGLVLSTAGLAMGGAGLALASPAYLAWLLSRLSAGEEGAAAGWLASAHVLGQGAGALAGGYAFAFWPPLPLFSCSCLAVLVAVAALVMKPSKG